MKLNKFTLTLTLLCGFIIMLTACKNEKKITFESLNGVWIGEAYGSQVSIVFINEIAFFTDDGIAMQADYNIENNEGSIYVWYNDYKFKLNGNVLTITGENDKYYFNKDTNVKESPSSIDGVWYGPSPWVFACLNNLVFITDEENDTDYGTFKLTGDKGEFECNGWLAGTFTVDGSELTIDETGYFNRIVKFTKSENAE